MKKIFNIFIIFIFAGYAFSATRTVSDAGGNWDATSAWAEGAVPIAGDAVVFTATSGDLVINTNTANLLSFDMTGYTGTLSGGSELHVSGSAATTQVCLFESSGSITWYGVLQILPSSDTATINITHNGLSKSDASCYVNGSSSLATINFLDAVNYYQLIVAKGIVHLDGVTDNAGLTHTFSKISTGATGQIYFGTCDWSANVAPGNAIEFHASSSVFPGTSTCTIGNAGNFTHTIILNGKSLYDMSITGGGTGAILFTSSGTISNTLTINKPKTVSLYSTGTLTVGELVADGDISNQITINSTTPGSAAIISDSSGTNQVTYCTIVDSTAQGGATWDAQTLDGNIDGGGNIGWLFPSTSSSAFLVMD